MSSYIYLFPLAAGLLMILLSSGAVHGAEFGIQNRYSERDQTCPAEQRKEWSYEGANGPPFWGLSYPECYDMYQSPIAIDSTDAITDENLAKLTLNNFDRPITYGIIENNGHTIHVTPEDHIDRTIHVNGDEYSLSQFHFHWGNVIDVGSEHTLDGRRYSMEMHLVYTNANNQTTVVGIFFQEEGRDNRELQKLVDEFPEVQFKDDKTEITSGINLNKLVPSNPTSYYRYYGSLTTPPCTEGVIWSVIPDAIPIGTEQMNEFRQLYAVTEKDAAKDCKLVNNFRPIQRLNKRQVFFSQ